MLIGREREFEKLVHNLRGGIHTLVFGAAGTGKSALIKEAAAHLGKSRESGALAVYICDCGNRRKLLEGAIAGLGRSYENTAGPRHLPDRSAENRRVHDLRNSLIAQGRTRSLCLLLDHLPKLHHRLEHLLEILEQHCTLACGVTAAADAYDLYYWKFDKLEVENLTSKLALSWIEQDLGYFGYDGSLMRGIAHEVCRLAGGNPGAISETIDVIRHQARPLDDPIRVRRMFVDGCLNRIKRISGT